MPIQEVLHMEMVLFTISDISDIWSLKSLGFAFHQIEKTVEIFCFLFHQIDDLDIGVIFLRYFEHS